ncbi:MAG: alpha/beta fold hydrolase [Bacteroidota bacterium]
MNKITLYTLFFSVFFIAVTFAQEEKFEYKSRPKEFEFIYHKGDSIINLKAPKAIDAESRLVFQSKIPYPIIFIHGLMSDSETWNTSTDFFDAQYGFTFGGRFDFCLNADGNHTLANRNFYPTPGADITAFEPSIGNGDYYYVNFNVKTNGAFGTDVLSNQAAVAKQGAALKKAVERVLQITGKDKVILVGHSMGGLCSREYIQNSANWQADGSHHVAKFLTAGTPNGGSNSSDNPLGIFTDVDVRSEAIRDLKMTYYYSGEGSHYLFGGKEVISSSSMNDNSSSPDFYNLDVNCNGVIEATANITGLNQRPIDNLIDFSNIAGRITDFWGSNVTTDGIVPEPSSKLNQFYPSLTYPAKMFYFNSGYDIIENHTELPGYYNLIMQGLDEPNFKELAYHVDINKPYSGFTTVQENTSAADNDFYKITIADNMNVNVVVSSFGTGSGAILNSAGTLVGTTQNSSGGAINFTRTLAPGSYFLRLTTNTPSASSYLTPYVFTANATLSNPNNEFDAVYFYPNPVTTVLNVENISFNRATVTSILGQKIFEINSDGIQKNQTIDMSTLSKGIYLVTFEKEDQLKTIKIIKE